MDANNIVMPKMRHRFRVRFFHKNGESPTPLEVLTQQIINFRMPDQRFDARGINHHQIYFVYSDDVLSLSNKAINEAASSSIEFCIVVEMTDGDGAVIEQIKFSNCKISCTVYVNELNYEATSSDDIRRGVHIDCDVPTYIYSE